MRKIFALLLVLMLAVSFMTVSAAADGFENLPPPSQDVEDDGGGNDNDNGGNSGYVAGPGERKDFTEPPVVEEETTVPTEETVPTTEATTVPTEVTTVPTEPTVTEAPAVTEAAATTQPDPNTVLAVSQQIIGNSTEQVVEEAPETDSGSETYLLVALIAGLGAVCAVLVIRRILDV